MAFSETDCVFIMGQRGCGKSYLCQKIQKIWPRRVILDPMQEYTNPETGVPIYPGATVVRSFEEFGAEIYSRKNSKKFELIYQFDEFNSNYEIEFDEICKIIYFFGSVQLVLEEVQTYATTHQLPHWLRILLLKGRHKGISLLFTSQRPGEINKTIFSQCSHIFCGQIIEGNDLRYISNFLNEKTQRLTTLPKRRFLWRSATGTKEISNDFRA